MILLVAGYFIVSQLFICCLILDCEDLPHVSKNVAVIQVSADRNCDSSEFHLCSVSLACLSALGFDMIQRIGFGWLHFEGFLCKMADKFLRFSFD
jgi:hypothetical protein